MYLPVVSFSADLSFLLSYLFKVKFKCHLLPQILLDLRWFQWSIYFHNLITLWYGYFICSFSVFIVSSLNTETVNYSAFSAPECLTHCGAHNEGSVIYGYILDTIGLESTKHNIQKPLATQYNVEYKLFTLVTIWLTRSWGSLLLYNERLSYHIWLAQEKVKIQNLKYEFYISQGPSVYRKLHLLMT